jgi:3-phenylpropionate/trans-cinnamate dioxygenase ferredoxin subunit
MSLPDPAAATHSPDRHVIGAVDEIAPGQRKIVEIAGRSIGIFNIGGEFFALRNRCPHQGGPLCVGKLWGALSADVPGEIHYEREGEILTCAWHGWEYDVRTGQSWCDPRKLRVRSYDVTIASGSDILGTDESAADCSAPAPAAAIAAGMVRGPYVAETYPVSVDGRYVVVEVPV